MPHKICPECKKSHGPRKLICDCGYAFGKTSKASTDTMMVTSPKKKPKFKLVGGPVEKRKPKPKPKPKPLEPDDFIEDFKAPQFGRVLNILIPSGYPPAKPKGYVGEKPHYQCNDPWPNGQPDDEEIIEWAHKVIDAGIKVDENYTLTAILFYARHFWEYNTPEYQHVRVLLVEEFRS